MNNNTTNHCNLDGYESYEEFYENNSSLIGMSGDVLDLLKEDNSKDNNAFLPLNLNNLSDQIVVNPDPQKAYAAKRNEMMIVKKEMKQAVDDVLIRHMHKNPSSHNFCVRSSIVITQRTENPINFKKAYKSIMNCLLDRNQIAVTQKAILEHVKTSTGMTALNANFWTMKLPGFTRKDLQRLVYGAGFTFSLSGCNTLSQIRKVCRAYFLRDGAKHKATVRLSVDDNSFIVNDKTYPIVISSVNGVDYKRIGVPVAGKKVWVREDALEFLLFDGNKSKN